MSQVSSVPCSSLSTVLSELGAYALMAFCLVLEINNFAFPPNRIYATPSLILRSCGSVGMSLLLWVLGALIAAAGTAVFIEFGTVM